MRLHGLIAGLFGAALASAWASVPPAWAEDGTPVAQSASTAVPKSTPGPAVPQVPPAPTPEPLAAEPPPPPEPLAPKPAGTEPAPAEPAATEPLTAQPPAGEPSAAEPLAAEPGMDLHPPPADPVVTIVRAKLVDPDMRKDANADDVSALEAFYGAWTDGPLWITEMGFSARAQAVIYEIDKADDWGLAAAFDLPPADTLPATPEAQALAEIKLALAILKYARYARGGRFNPPAISGLLDQKPQLRDPRAVLAEVEAADAPDAYLRSLHPKHEHFARLRQALLAARGKKGENAKPQASDRDIKRIVLNMERWRWMPEKLGETYVWLNTPEYMLYVVKDGKTVFADKTLVGTINNATPIFSAGMATIVFNPEWIAPRTVLTEALLPPLRKGNYSFLKKHRISVSYGGKPVDAAKVDWGRANIHSYTFIQAPGPNNNLGKIKFLYPNRHDVYMHDTLPSRRKVFQKSERSIGYGCVRMEKPQELAALLIAEDKGWPASRVKGLWDKSVNSAVALDRRIPVHTTYFTAVADENGKVKTYADLYGIDRKLATAMFGDATGFPVPPPPKKEPRAERADSGLSTSRTESGSGGGRGFGAFFGN
jgi:murein L,D-transpeptidase YcbB/YkuD